jgi:spore coat protein U-like protein
MNFGNYSGAAVTATAAVNVVCTNTTTYNVGLDKGANGASVTARQMKSGTNLLNYSLFRDSAQTLNWGTTVGTDTLAGTGNGNVVTPQQLTVYGQVPANQFVVPGAYTDTITATITY